MYIHFITNIDSKFYQTILILLKVISIYNCYQMIIMLGDIIYEQKGKISGYRVLDTEGPTIETTITGIGSINGIEVI